LRSKKAIFQASKKLHISKPQKTPKQIKQNQTFPKFQSQNKHIRLEEIRQIEDSGHKSKMAGDKDVKTPWATVFGSVVVWAIAMSSFSQNFMNVGTVVYLPAYYQTVLGMKLSKVSKFWIFCGLKQEFLFLGHFTSGRFSDRTAQGILA
jgi:hypothetical protein